jgi:hypothetical protein
MSRVGAISRAEDMPLFRLGFGVFLLLLWVAFSSFTILTTEDLFMGGNGSGITPSWRVLTQLWGLVQGEFHGREVISILGAWAIFVIYIASSIAEWVTPDNKGEDAAFKTICWLIMFLDGFANWNYLRVLPPEYQWLFTILIFTVVVYCWKKAFNIIIGALQDMAGG